MTTTAAGSSRLKRCSQWRTRFEGSARFDLPDEGKGQQECGDEQEDVHAAGDPPQPDVVGHHHQHGEGPEPLDLGLSSPSSLPSSPACNFRRGSRRHCSFQPVAAKSACRTRQHMLSMYGGEVIVVQVHEDVSNHSRAFSCRHRSRSVMSRMARPAGLSPSVPARGLSGGQQVALGLAGSPDVRALRHHAFRHVEVETAGCPGWQPPRCPWLVHVAPSSSSPGMRTSAGD